MSVLADFDPETGHHRSCVEEQGHVPTEPCSCAAQLYTIAAVLERSLEQGDDFDLSWWHDLTGPVVEVAQLGPTGVGALGAVPQAVGQ